MITRRYRHIAEGAAKRAAQSKVVQMIVPGVGTVTKGARTGTEA
jgi:hypothetical protein